MLNLMMIIVLIIYILSLINKLIKLKTQVERNKLNISNIELKKIL